MAPDPLEAALDRLHAAPLESWVAERGRIAKELKAAGEGEVARALAREPKPTAAAWAVNHVAREDPTLVDAWSAAAAALRAASAGAGPSGGDALRAAITDHREATERLVSAVSERARPGGRALSGAMTDRVRALLQTAAADAELTGLLRAGRASETRPEPDATPRERRKRDTPARPRKARGARSVKAAPRRDPAKAAAEREATRRRAEAETEARDAEQAAATLAGEAENRGAGAEAAEQRVADARAALAEALAATADAKKAARAAATRAEREAARLRRRLEA